MSYAFLNQRPGNAAIGYLPQLATVPDRILFTAEMVQCVYFLNQPIELQSDRFDVNIPARRFASRAPTSSCESSGLRFGFHICRFIGTGLNAGGSAGYPQAPCWRGLLGASACISPAFACIYLFRRIFSHLSVGGIVSDARLYVLWHLRAYSVV